MYFTEACPKIQGHPTVEIISRSNDKTKFCLSLYTFVIHVLCGWYAMESKAFLFHLQVGITEQLTEVEHEPCTIVQGEIPDWLEGNDALLFFINQPQHCGIHQWQILNIPGTTLLFA